MKCLVASTVLASVWALSSSMQGISVEKRSGKNMSVVGEIGLGIAPLPTAGMSAGYFIRQDILAELNYINGSATLLDSNLSWSVITARAKWFLGNSFYINTGAGVRDISFDSSYSMLGLASESKSIRASTSAIGLDVGLGNQWQWDTFTMGCDWIGYFQPVSVSNRDGDSTGLSQSDLNSFKSSTSMGEESHLSLLRFYLGASF